MRESKDVRRYCIAVTIPVPGNRGYVPKDVHDDLWIATTKSQTHQNDGGPRTHGADRLISNRVVVQQPSNEVHSSVVRFEHPFGLRFGSRSDGTRSKRCTDGSEFTTYNLVLILRSNDRGCHNL